MDKKKATSILKSKNFWGYVLTGAGSFLAGSGDIVSFITGIFNWFANYRDLILFFLIMSKTYFSE